MKKTVLLATLAIAAFAFTAGPASARDGIAVIEKQETLQKTLATPALHVDVVHVVALPAPESLQIVDTGAAQAETVVQLLRADQYAMRLIERQRPVITPAWRECPSV